MTTDFTQAPLIPRQPDTSLRREISRVLGRQDLGHQDMVDALILAVNAHGAWQADAVAWRHRLKANGCGWVLSDDRPQCRPEDAFEIDPLYTHPPAASARIAELEAALRDAADNGLIYWEPITTRGHVQKAKMLERIRAALAGGRT